MLGSAARLVLGLALLGVALPGLAHDRDFDIAVLSSRADTVTGDDALIRVDVPGKVPLGKVRVLLNGADVTDALKASRRSHSLTGLVSGLREGVNHLKVYGAGHHHHKSRPAAELVLTNYPITGPVFSGPHEAPFICETQFFTLPDGSNLGPALDANCSIATRVDYFYRTTANAWARLADLTTHPADLASTTTNEGKTVPFIIRMETGTANRSIYQTTILHDPANEKTPGFARQPKGWNGRLIFTFGGGCINGWYRQGRNTGGVLDINMLGLGYAVASSSLNVFGNNCNELLAAESMMMAKERFIEAYGPPRWTLGFGCSGGSYQQHQIGDNYPGLLQGIIPGCSFPEVGFATIYMITDAWLLDNYFNNVAPGLFTPEQQRAVTGFLVLNTMPNVAVGARRIDPRVFCPAVLPAADRYHPITNPTGVRCDVYDHTVNVYGRDPMTGFARRPLDNVGVQYGLKSLNAKVISVDQFLALNEGIGGFDQDANIVPKRSEADDESIRAAYRSGRLTNGGLGLGEIPIIDYRAYNDDAAGGDIHVRYHSFSMRGRIKEANGHAKNHVMLVEDIRYGLYSTASPLLRFAIAKMDEWIGNVEADHSHRSRAEKVVRAKPKDLQDGCNTRDPAPTFIAEPQVLRKGQCEQLYPSAPPPREVAGAPNEADIIKCRLKRIDWDDYKVSFSDAQKAKLRSIFPDGVCDYSKRGVGQRAPAGTWQFF
jgi:hypothetical protein